MRERESERVREERNENQYQLPAFILLIQIKFQTAAWLELFAEIHSQKCQSKSPPEKSSATRLSFLSKPSPRLLLFHRKIRSRAAFAIEIL